MALCFSMMLYGLNKNASVYITPSQILLDHKICPNNCRLGALVQHKSLHVASGSIYFVAQDYNMEKITIPVVFSGLLPSLFKEGSMMIAEGKYRDKVFYATRVLAKHDENYQPPV